MSEKVRSLRAIQNAQKAEIRRQKLLGYQRMLEKLKRGEPVSTNDIMIAWKNDRSEIFEQYSEKVHLLYAKLRACKKQKKKET